MHFVATMKKQKCSEMINLFDLLAEEIVFEILDCFEANPFDRKSFSLVCKSFYIIESKHRKQLKPLRQEHLPRILTRYPNTTHLDLSLCPRINDSSLSTVSKISNNTLQSVDLSRSGGFTSFGLLTLTRSCKNLKEIDVSNSVSLKDAGAAALAEAKNLEKLWMGRCKMVTDIGVGCIAVGCKNLKLISLRWCLSVGDLGVGLIAVKCKQIRSLDLSYIPITNKCLPSVLKLKHLEDLILEGCFEIDDCSMAALKHGCMSLKVTPAPADGLKKLSMLQSIKLDGSLITRAGLKAIGDWCVSLKELSLSKCDGVTDEGLSSVVAKHRDLMKLDITCCRKITDVSITHVTSSCTALTSLRMESCTLVPREAFVLIGQRCRFLEELDLTDNEIDDEGLKSVSRCSKLSVLKLGICLNITDEGLAHVGMCCSKLKEIDLYRCVGVADSGILAIACGCPDLEMINIAYLKDITDRSLISLSKCSRLNTFEARGCPLVTSLGLAVLSVGCTQLTKLDIKWCHNINDVGMLPLARFSQNLRQINLSYTSVTDMGLLSLASIGCLQNMTVLHLKGLTPNGLAASLLACGGITKVKLHTSFRPLLPQAVIDYLEARGCVFQWRHKMFQVELDPNCWKLQLEEMMQ